MIRNRRGQFVIEGILLMVVMLGVFIVTTRLIRENEVATRMVTGPWSKVAGMTENGVWSEANNATRRKHPNNFERFFTSKE
ncbi:MAG: hypothetical protein KF802_08770 [Bdellovibrionaceae bacterium]|nr:hypothetical protein [Pseudobdellovibrionaceae bacterium]